MTGSATQQHRITHIQAYIQNGYPMIMRRNDANGFSKTFALFLLALQQQQQHNLTATLAVSLVRVIHP